MSIVQPLIAPLYGGKSAHEVVATLVGSAERTGYDIVREYWMANGHGAAAQVGRYARQRRSRAAAPTGAGSRRRFEKSWREWLHDGFIAGTAFAPTTVGRWHGGARSARAGARPTALEVNFRRDPTSTTAASPTTAGCRNCPSR